MDIRHPKDLEWQGLCVTVLSNSRPKVILHDAQCHAKAREIVGLLGPSGAGKTTLLHALAWRSTKAKLVGLLPVKHTRVGGLLAGGVSVRGISGGERKRLSVICGIARCAPILFLDEPTSSLDSYAAVSMMKALKQLAYNGHTLIASIHQPPAAIWSMFDQVVLLSHGRTLYVGPGQQAESWFSGNLGYPYSPAAHGAISEWLLQLVTTSFTADESEPATMRTAEDVVQAATAWAAAHQEALGKHAALHTMTGLDMSVRHAGADVDPAGAIVIRIPSGDVAPGAVAPQPPNPSDNQTSYYHVGWFTQFRVLYVRAAVNCVRNPMNMGARILASTWLGVFIGLVFLNLGTDAAGAQARLTCIADLLLVMIVMPFVYMAPMTFNKLTYASESVSNLYSSTAYYCAVALADLPTNIVSALALAWPVYALAGFQRSASALGIYTFVQVFQHLITSQVLQVAAYVLPNQDMAFIGAIAYVNLVFQLGGFFRPNKDLIGFCKALGWTSYSRYAYQAAAQAELQGFCSDFC
ncbi:hypothetical protein WJX72_006338 [[Myrmecia] bisecta]|uniref:ABC transporter domain-containing protein n=1 Tax=[Myrmecia] bisecta TaxID=41462 RepID=A0AAW1QFE0_9CHLO